MNATGIFGIDERLPLITPVRPGFPSLKMITPEAPALVALATFVSNVHEPRWISAMFPAVKPVKSLGLQPLVDVDPFGSGGSTMPPAGWTGLFVAVPLLRAGSHSLLST